MSVIILDQVKEETPILVVAGDVWRPTPSPTPPQPEDGDTETWMEERGLVCCAPRYTEVKVVPFEPGEVGYVETIDERISRWESRLQHTKREGYTGACAPSRSARWTGGQYDPGSEYAAFRPVPGQWGCRYYILYVQMEGYAHPHLFQFSGDDVTSNGLTMDTETDRLKSALNSYYMDVARLGGASQSNWIFRPTGAKELRTADITE
jgi:hypothetical protein